MQASPATRSSKHCRGDRCDARGVRSAKRGIGVAIQPVKFPALSSRMQAIRGNDVMRAGDFTNGQERASTSVDRARMCIGVGVHPGASPRPGARRTRNALPCARRRPYPDRARSASPAPTVHLASQDTELMTRIAVQVYPQHCAFSDIRRAFSDRGGARSRPRLHLGPLLPALRRLRRRPLRMLHDAGRARGRDLDDSVRTARRVQLVPEPGTARRHGPHHRPHLRRPIHPRYRVGVVRARLRRVRLRVRHRAEPPAGPRRRHPPHEGAHRQAQPTADGPAADDDRRRRREGHPAPDRGARRHLARIRKRQQRQAFARRAGAAQETRCSTPGARRSGATRRPSTGPLAWMPIRSISPMRSRMPAPTRSPSGWPGPSSTSAR